MMKKLWQASCNWVYNTWLGRVYVGLALADLIARSFSWELGHQIVIALMGIQTLVCISYGIRWAVRKLTGFIAGEFRSYVREIVHEELRPSPRV